MENGNNQNLMQMNARVKLHPNKLSKEPVYYFLACNVTTIIGLY